MKITDIPHIYKNLSRTAEIVAILSRYGLAEWLHRMNVDLSLLPFPHKDEIKDLSHKTFAERLRLALEELGPCFIKMGQILSTRADIVTPEVLAELKKLQTATPEDREAYVSALLRNELGETKYAEFKRFDTKPIASASIGQVHEATLNDGSKVVVKIRHENVVSVVDKDLEIIAALAELAAKSKDIAIYDPVGIIEEFSSTLRGELDFRRELRNIEKFRKNFADVADVKIPRVYEQLSSGKVLTMERLDGCCLARGADESWSEDTRKSLAKRGAQVFLDMIFDFGLFHADPHPGNFIIIDAHIIGLIDFGMVGYLDEYLREEIENMLMAILHNDADLLASIILRLGRVPRNVDKSRMQRDVREFVSYYGTISIAELPLAKILEDLLAIIRKYSISLPSQAAMLIKVLIMLEGTSHLLNPDFSLLEILSPLQQKIIKRRLSPERNLRKMRRLQDQIEHVLARLPGQLLDIVDEVQKGDLKVSLNHTGMSTSVNRMVLGLIASSLFLGGSLMLSIKVHPLLFTTPYHGFKDISAIGLVVMFYSIYLILKLFHAIKKSGRL